MKKPRKITAPPKDTRKELYFEIKSDCIHDWHDGENGVLGKEHMILL
jgi:hypothetical protein